MANRTTKVTLVAEVSQLLEGMEKAARATREVGSEAEKLAQKRQAMEGLGRSALVFGALAAAGVALAVAKFAEFDQAMSNVNAVTQETAANQALLRDAALEAGGRTVYTATEAANAIEELGKAGLATADILGGGLDGALDLAASGQLEVARAAEITATTLKQYNLAGDQAGRVADVLSAGAGKALGSVEDLAQGLKFVGPVAQAMGISLEETTATLALFADQGIVGEQAGTSLRGMLSSLTSPSKQARAEIDELGITLYDASGTFLGLENAAGELNKAYGEMDGASRDASLGILFGNQQLTAANVLASKGADAVAEYTEAVNESGYAARVAADRLDNLAGDVEKLGGAFDTALIKSGSGANDILRTMVQSATFLVDGFGELPQPVLDAGLAIGSVAASVALAGGTALTAIPKIADFRASLDTMGISGRTAAIGIGAAGAAIGVAALVLSTFIQRQAEARAKTDALVATMVAGSGEITDATREQISANLAAKDSWFGFMQQDSVFDAAEKLGLSLETVSAAATGNAAALSEVNSVVSLSADENDKYQAALKASGLSSYDFNNAILKVREGLKGEGESLAEATKIAQQKEAADRKAASAAQDQADALSELEGSAVGAGKEISELADIIRGFGSTTLDVRSAEREFQASIDDVTESIAANGATLDLNTDAGRSNEAALDDLTEATLNRAAAILEQTGSEEQAEAAIMAGRDALILQLAAFGIVGDEAEAYADSLGLVKGAVESIPVERTVKLVVETWQAMADIEAFTQAVNGRTVGVNVVAMPARANGGIEEYASGGVREGHYQGRPGGLIKFAEPETGWETFISGRPGYERQNIGYAIESLGRLGVDLSQLARPAAGNSVDVGGITVVGDDPFVTAQLVEQRLSSEIARWLQ